MQKYFAVYTKTALVTEWFVTDIVIHIVHRAQHQFSGVTVPNPKHIPKSIPKLNLNQHPDN